MKSFTFLMWLIVFSSIANSQDGNFRSGVFLHHSTGGCIWGPNGGKTSLPVEIAAYNSSNNLTGNDAFSLTERGWPENPWDNEWYRWHNIFQNKDADADIKPFLQANKIIIIKSCFPSSSMEVLGKDDDTLQPTKKTIPNYKWHWRNMIGAMKAHPECFFVIWTNAPLVASATNDQQAMISHKFCKWAKDTLPTEISPGYGEFPKNVYIFDFFHKLVGTDNKLQAKYAASADDSHPNGAATELAAPQFVKEVCNAAIAYEKSTSVKNDKLTNYSCEIRYSFRDFGLPYIHIIAPEKSEIKYEIYKLNGILCFTSWKYYSTNTETDISIDSNFDNGIYFLNILVGKERYGLVFIK